MNTVKRASSVIVSTMVSGIPEGHVIPLNLRENTIVLILEVVFGYNSPSSTPFTLSLMDTTLEQAEEDRGGAGDDTVFLANPSVICGAQGAITGAAQNAPLAINLRPGFPVVGDLIMRSYFEVSNTFRRSIQVFYVIKKVSQGDYMKFLKTRL